jgi:hypothetical protein
MPSHRQGPDHAIPLPGHALAATVGLIPAASSLTASSLSVSFPAGPVALVRPGTCGLGGGD